MNLRSPGDLRRVLIATALLLVIILFLHLLNCLESCSERDREVKQIKIGGALLIAEVEE